MKQVSIDINNSYIKRNWLLTIQDGVIFHNYNCSVEHMIFIRSQIDKLLQVADNQSEDKIYSIENGILVQSKVNNILYEEEIHEYILKYTLNLRSGDIITGKVFICKDDFVNRVITEVVFEGILYKYNLRKADVKSIFGEWIDL